VWWSIVRALCWVVVRVYYRRLDVVGRQHVPTEGPTLLVINHPNSLLDAAAVFLAMPRPVRMGAKEPLFRTRLWGPLLRRVGSIPIHRPQDAGSDRSRNQETYQAYVDALHAGGACAIFPEGYTHVEPALQYVKAGAARIALQAEEERGDGPSVRIVPVGLIFHPAQAFRGDAHVRFGEPFGIEDLAGRPREESIPALQQRMRDALVPLMVHLDRVDLKPLVADVARVWEHSRRTSGDLPEHVSRADIQRLAGHCLNHFLATDPDLVEQVRERHAAYRRHAEDSGIDIYSLDLRERPVRWSLRFAGLCVQLILGLPFFVLGMLFAYVPGRLTDHVARRVAEKTGAAALPVARIVVGAAAFGLFWTPVLWLLHDWAGDWRVTACFAAVMALTSLALAGYRRRVRAWRQRFFAVAPGFVRRRALAKAVAARERLLWQLQEAVLRYEAETGEAVLPTQAARLRRAERRQRRTYRLRRLAFVAAAGLAAALTIAPPMTTTQSLAAMPSPWGELHPEQVDGRLLHDAVALVGYLDTLRAVEERSDELLADFGQGRRDDYTPGDTAAVRDCFAQFLTSREGLLRLAWYYSATPDDRPEDVRVRAFVLAHTSIVELCARGMQLLRTFGDDPDAFDRLNEADPSRGIPAGVMADIRAGLGDRDNLDRLADGVERFEALRAENALPEGPPWDRLVLRAREGADVVEDLAARSFGYDVRTRLDRVVGRGETGRYAVSTLVSTWIGDARVRRRPDRPGLISPDQVEWLREQLRPGDILLERRNWYLSNAFLPGFWPHSALYLGRPEDLHDLGIADDPRVRRHLDDLAGSDADGHPYAVIEAISDGVVLTSLEHSAGGADAVCVLRPNLPPDRIAECIARALSHRGKPYDFDFDFFSTDRLVCTEVVYQAYADDLDIELVEIMGRRTLPALEYVRMWAEQRDAPDPAFELVAFLDHDEEGDRAIPGDADALRATLDRPGLTLLGSEAGRPRVLSWPVLVLIALALIALGLPRRRIVDTEGGEEGRVE
jgi:1-acyl-sn-glycerol-3-phosphate acyltransferase